MKALLLLLVGSSAMAQYNYRETKIGNTTYGSGYDYDTNQNISIRSNTIGNTTYQTINKGLDTTSCRTTTIGNQTYTNCY